MADDRVVQTIAGFHGRMRKLLLKRWPSVATIACKYMSDQEIESACQHAVVVADRRFDPSFGMSFLNYVAIWVRSIVQLELRTRLGGRSRTYVESGWATADNDPTHSVPDDPVKDPVLAREWADAVRREVMFLPNREREIIVRHFGLDGKGGMTVREAGRQLGIGRARVGQIYARAKHMLSCRLSRFHPRKGEGWSTADGPAAGDDDGGTELAGSGDQGYATLGTGHWRDGDSGEGHTTVAADGTNTLRAEAAADDDLRQHGHQVVSHGEGVDPVVLSAVLTGELHQFGQEPLHIESGDESVGR